jgi:transforming growth factor-beta-induced protein
MHSALIIGGALVAAAFTPFAQDCQQDTKNGCPAQGARAALASHAAEKSIVATARDAGSFGTLLAAAQAAGLVEALEGRGPLTVFAPTDEAFAKLPEGTVAELLKPENKERLARILKYHVVSGEVMAEAVVKLRFAATLSGQRVDIRVGKEGDTKGKVFVDRATVVRTDIDCTNGVIHVIDSVLMPAQENIVELAAGAGTFQTLIAAAKAAGLVEALTGEGPLTVFAPTDEAFGKLPKGTVESLLLPENKEKLASILKLHVVAGRVYADAVVEAKSVETLLGQHLPVTVNESGVKVGTANVVKTDLEATNGVVHVIDSVLLPR